MTVAPRASPIRSTPQAQGVAAPCEDGQPVRCYERSPRPFRICLAAATFSSLPPRGTSGGRVGESLSYLLTTISPPLPGPLLPCGRRGSRATLNTYPAVAELQLT